MKEEYERIDNLRKKELDYHHAALDKLGDKPFSQKAAKLKNGVFNQAGSLSYIGGGKRPETIREVNKAEHERAFRPSQPGRRGVGGTLDKFPEYKENPLKHLTRVKPVDGADDEKARWKMTTNAYSKPTTSIATNMRNMKASFPTIFNRR